jgi:hypothetical protein
MSLPDIDPKTKNQKPKTLIVRPEMAAPEIDDYDEVLISDIIGDIEIGSKVEYTLRSDASPHRDETINRHD